MIEKLSPSGKDFKNYLKHKHKHKEMNLKDLIMRLQIEERTIGFSRKRETKAFNTKEG